MRSRHRWASVTPALTLDMLISRQAEVLSIAHDVASGLAYLHTLDLCHGDLRAENVMMQTLTDPWLSLACMPPECAGGPWTPEVADAVGASSGADVAHLPPELLLSGRLHPSSDVYSLGVLLWRMLSPTGEQPYGKLRPAEVAYKVVACGMRPAFSPAVPEPLRRLVEDCWQSDPAARPTITLVLQRLTEL
ncbi:hypothetical protein VOLCADRAFT_61650, partial [Volvox carteri f. nagariensis]